MGLSLLTHTAQWTNLAGSLAGDESQTAKTIGLRRARSSQESTSWSWREGKKIKATDQETYSILGRHVSSKNNNVKMYGCNIFRKMHGCCKPKFPKDKQEQKKQSARNTRPTETAVLAEEMPLSSTTPPYYIGHKRKNRKLHRMRARSQSPTGICCYYSFASRTNPER